MKQGISVLLADDHTLIRRGLVKLLEMADDIKVIGQAENGFEVVSMAKELKPDVILMDINMPGLNGIEATRAIIGGSPEMPILALTIHDDEEYISEMIRAGARGYLLKDCELSNVVQAITRLADGESFFPSNLMEKVMIKYHELLAQQKHQGDEQPLNIELAVDHNLTRRELEVLRCIVDGMSNKECAQSLFISEKTVKNHITNLLRKLEVADRTQAAVYAVQNKIIRAKSKEKTD